MVALKKFTQLIELYSEGALVGEVHFRGSNLTPEIMGEEVNVTMLMSGNSGVHKKVHVTAVAAGNVSFKAKILEFLMLPYIFEDKYAAQRLFNSELMTHQVNKVLIKKHNIRALGWLIGGYRHLTNAIKPINKIEDIQGLAIRTPINHLMVETYRVFGAKVVPLSWNKTFLALKSKRVQGQENPYSVIVDSKFWLANQKYITKNGPFLWVGPILINETFFQNLPVKMQKIVEKSGEEASKFQWRWSHENTQHFLNILKENNMEIMEVEDKPKWISAVKPLWRTQYKIIGYGNEHTGKKLVERVVNITSQAKSEN
ncbi:TRAP-type C4-dicarboxylate transport system, substrate-binding protein [Pseudoalteromonas denitrificans DSM 6059]|uniref:TRAP-type C4-dicarboxylate transport system, substrate-binding protein n=1 Tax=Pseudoalteromonas denitrificans DSM 6059 TaxID=1123010 RepID=A0A1I1N395_9GAMM|nr:TRAP-type C4-dicarboxylate transport system, substrate-binding protein [Pseudoalteromonas denitrificans DSM 6059]